MSRIGLRPGASGTGTFTIASPNSNTDRTLTLPDAAGAVVIDEAGGGSVKIDSSGNVGIGTSSPNEPLHVIGTVRSETSSTGDFNFYATSTGGGAYRIYPDDATTSNPTWLHQSNSSEDQAWVIGGVERMRIDNEGRVTMPYQPAITVYDPIFTALSNGYKFQFTSTVSNSRGITASNSRSRLTVPVAGLYMLSYTVSGACTTASSGDGIQIRPLRNGSAYPGEGANPFFSFGDVNGNEWHVSQAILLDLSASDYVEIDVDNIGASAATVNYGHMSLYLVA